jgi:catechol 2,3-dioxygenase-like lactoylglutathione lyase family enzyme
MYPAHDPAPLSSSHLRIARPTRDLARTERFWVTGLGLEVLERVQPQDRGEHELVMLGWPGAAWHLELVSDPDGQSPPAPTEEDLLVLYLGQPAGNQLIGRLVGAGGRLVPARNPYWDRWGVTIADPDGYRLVLTHRTWS